VRNVVTESQLMYVGSIGISSSGQSGIEIFIRGIPNPYDVKTIIDFYRFGDSTVRSHASDDAQQSNHPVA